MSQGQVTPSIIATDDAHLRSDVRRLGDLLGQSLVRQEGPELLELVEKVRKAVRDNGEDAILADITDDQAVDLVRAFSTYFHLANVAEQVHRSRVLAEARRDGKSWLSQAVDKIIEAQNNPELGHEFTHEDVVKWVSELQVRPVFTAHPTEAARRSILGKLSEISTLLDLPKSITQDERLAETVDLLWQTDELRLEQPQVLDEARNALYYLDDLTRGPITAVLGDLAATFAELGVELDPTSRPLTFGSWIGGDRDGNPFVTPEVTEDVLVFQRDHAVLDLMPIIDELLEDLSISERIAGQVSHCVTRSPSISPLFRISTHVSCASMPRSPYA